MTPHETATGVAELLLANGKARIAGIEKLATHHPVTTREFLKRRKVHPTAYNILSRYDRFSDVLEKA